LFLNGLAGNNQVAFVSDLSDKSEHYTKVFNAFRTATPNVGISARGIAHLDDKNWPGLQAADLCAHIAKQRFDQWNGDKQQTEPVGELKNSCFYFVAYWNESYMRSVLARQSLA
jgi:hypothetical protein